MTMDDKASVDRAFAAMGESLDKAALRQEQVDLLADLCGDDEEEFEEALSLLEARWREEDGEPNSDRPMTANIETILSDVDDTKFDEAVASLIRMTGEPEAASPAAASRSELANKHHNVYDLAAFQEKKAAQVVTFAPGWESELRTGTRSQSETTEAVRGWQPRSSAIKPRGGRFRVSFDWVGKNLEANDVILFVDGMRIDGAEMDLRSHDNDLRILFDLPDDAGEEVELARAETCLEDDGTVRVQLWTESSPSSAATDFAVIEATVIATLKDFVADWNLVLDGPIRGETTLVGDLDFDSIDVVQFLGSLEQAVGKENLPFEKLFTDDIGNMQDISVTQITKFCATELGDNSLKFGDLQNDLQL